MEFVTTSDNDIAFYAIWTINGLQCDLNTLLKGLGFGIIHHYHVLSFVLEGQVLDLGIGQCVFDSNTAVCCKWANYIFNGDGN